jgi:hypothetical protein
MIFTVVQKVVFPLYSCWFQHYTIIGTTTIFHAIINTMMCCCA